jgi:hypothetical protein
MSGLLKDGVDDIDIDNTMTALVEEGEADALQY